MPRISKKRSDKRWVDDTGQEWASKFEYDVYAKLVSDGLPVRKCEKGGLDTFSYHSPVKNGMCSVCYSTVVIQERTYTPDLSIDIGGNPPIYIETKGYFPGEKRNLLRAFQKTGPEIDLRMIAQQDHWVTKGKTRLSDYFKRYLKKFKFIKWTGKLPEDWL